MKAQLPKDRGEGCDGLVEVVPEVAMAGEHVALKLFDAPRRVGGAAGEHLSSGRDRLRQGRHETEEVGVDPARGLRAAVDCWRFVHCLFSTRESARRARVSR